MNIHAEFQENIEFWDETHQDRYLKHHMTQEQRQGASINCIKNTQPPY